LFRAATEVKKRGPRLHLDPLVTWLIARTGTAPAAPPFSGLPLPLSSAASRLGLGLALPGCASDRATQPIEAEHLDR
jgi:hypothetical protein